MRSGQSVLIPEVSSAYLEGIAEDPEHLQMLRDLGFRSILSVPLPGRERILGAISMVASDSRRRFSEADLAIAEDLGRLRDKLPPFDWEQAHTILTTELGLPPERLFNEIDTTPVAAASVAQVHMASTSDGLPVAVKILRPGVEAAFARDLAQARTKALDWLQANP